RCKLDGEFGEGTTKDCDLRLYMSTAMETITEPSGGAGLSEGALLVAEMNAETMRRYRNDYLNARSEAIAFRRFFRPHKADVSRKVFDLIAPSYAEAERCKQLACDASGKETLQPFRWAQPRATSDRVRERGMRFQPLPNQRPGIQSCDFTPIEDPRTLPISQGLSWRELVGMGTIPTLCDQPASVVCVDPLKFPNKQL
ncbi:unnamed protein product, partial [marine sediment metagenome]